MKGFIEVTDYDGGMRVILPVDKITSIVCDKAKSVFIEMGVNNKGISSGILVQTRGRAILFYSFYAAKKLDKNGKKQYN